MDVELVLELDVVLAVLAVELLLEVVLELELVVLVLAVELLLALDAVLLELELDEVTEVTVVLVVVVVKPFCEPHELLPEFPIRMPNRMEGRTLHATGRMRT